MPEGDTVHLAADRLQRAFGGQRLTAFDLRVSAFATSDLSGVQVLEVVARGKHLFFRFDNELTLHTHFKMDGSWHLYQHGSRWRGPHHQVRAVLETDRWVAVGFRLPVVELMPTNDEFKVVGHLGPDVLGPDWDPDAALERLTAFPERAISEVLIDQRVMAGPGNVYKSEICFLAGVHPQTLVREIADTEAIVLLTKRTMEANRATGRQITTGDTRSGRGQWVYGRAGLPCRRCGTSIRREHDDAQLDSRVTFWCPSCQPIRPFALDGGPSTRSRALPGDRGATPRP